MIRSKQDPKLHDPELEELLSISDEELLRDAAEEGHDIPALVSSMKQRIAEKLRQAAQRPSSAEAARILNAESSAEGSGWRLPEPGVIAADLAHPDLDRDIRSLDLASISYLAVLQHRWSDEATAAAEREYRGWLQALRDGFGEVRALSEDGRSYWSCHLQHATLYLEQTTALFGRPLLRRPATQQQDRKHEAALLPAGRDAGFHDCLSGRYQCSEVSEDGVADDLDELLGRQDCPEHASAILDELGQLCAGDHAAQSVIRAARLGLSSARARKASELSTQAYDEALRRLVSLMRKRLPDQMGTFHVRADWKTGTVDVDDGQEVVDRSSHPARRSCAHCAAPTTWRVLRAHAVPVLGEPAVQRIVVHKVEMNRCMVCGASEPTLDGRIRIERGTHRALLFLYEQLPPAG